MKKIIILTDYKNWFWVSVKDLVNYTSMDVESIKSYLEDYDFSVEIIKYSDVAFSRDYNGYYVVYQTSEDVGLFYKDYIEDILLFFKRSGAILIPEFDYFRAHHNKNYMEMIRYTFNNPSLKTVRSSFYGNGLEALSNNNYPVVVKSAEGAGSRNVSLAHNRKELKKIIHMYSGVFIVNSVSMIKEFIINYYSNIFFNKVQGKYRSHTFYRKKFLTQNLIKNLSGDYKVLYYGGKYYTLYRQNRDNDFRASGGGKLSLISVEESLKILPFAKELVDELNVPILGMDLAFDGEIYHLIEFQMIHLGPYTLQASEGWFTYDENEWVYHEGHSDLEFEFSRSISEYINNSLGE